MIKKIIIIFLLLFEFYSSKINKKYSKNSISVFNFVNQIDKILIKDDNLILVTKNNLFLINSTNFDSQISRKNYLNKEISLNKIELFFRLDSKLDDYILIYKNPADLGKLYHCYQLEIKYNSIELVGNRRNCIRIGENVYNSILLPIELNEKTFYLIAYKNQNISHDYPFYQEFSKLKYSNNVFKITEYENKKSSISLYSEFDFNLIYLFDYGYYNSNGYYQKYAFLLRTCVDNEKSVTKLGRVHLDDISFESYTEISLICKNNDEIYSYASTSYFGFTDPFVSNRTNIRFYNKTLFVTFNKYDQLKKKIKESDGTVLCAFPFEQLNETYKNVINECYSGNKENTRLLNNGKSGENDQCHRSTNSSKPFIDYAKSLKGYFFYKFDNEIITSLITKPGKFFVGTTKCIIYRLEHDDSDFYLENSFKLSELNCSINPNPSILNDKIYFTSNNLLIEYKLGFNDDLNEPEIKNNDDLNEPEIKNNLNYLIYFISIISLLILAIVLIGLAYKLFNKKREDKKIMNETERKSSISIASDCDQIYLGCISNNCLKILNKINSGHFGSVYKGELKLSSKQIIVVAVKILKDKADETKNRILIDEANVMKDFRHENVLNLIGICFDENNSPRIILPYLEKGDLLNYIRSHQHQITISDLLNFAIQIGKGMVYLSGKGYVHRDLAARNCLLSNDLTIKISDFGLTKDIYESNYYRPGGSCDLPISWMAIESLEEGYFTTQSDVWSYGVVLWELFTLGNRPYFGFNINKLINYLKGQNRLEKPEYCPDEIYELMLDCWNSNYADRPAFTQIVEFLNNFIKKNDRRLEIYSSSSSNLNYPVAE